MIKIKYLLPVLVILSSTIITLFTSSVTSAVSSFDDTVATTDNLFLHSTGAGYTLPTECSSMPTVNLNDRWEDFVTELASDGVIDFGDNSEISMVYSFTSTSAPSAYNAWQNKTKWVVSQYTRENNNGYSNQISITWTDTSGENAVFGIVGGDKRLMASNSSNVYQMNITKDGSANCQIRANIQYWPTVGSSPSISYPVLAWKGTIDPWKIFFANWNITYPSTYEGIIPPDEQPSTKEQVYPGLSITVQDNGTDSDTSKVKLMFADTWSDFLSSNNITATYTPIFTLTDMNDEIIIPDRCWGPTGCDWNNLPLGSYKARLNVIFTDTLINETYNFHTTESWFEVNNTSYTMLYNPTEGKYCTVRGGYEWNCDIPQPTDEPQLITGIPAEWTEEPCTLEVFPWINLGACIRNSLHYLGEYLGINGPSINSSTSAFFQFDTNTFGLTSILTAPITILNNLGGAEYTCSTVNLPLPHMNDELELPCMNAYYTTYLGDLYTLWQTVINGIVSYFVIVGLLRMVKDAKDPQKDKIEVLAL